MNIYECRCGNYYEAEYITKMPRGWDILHLSNGVRLILCPKCNKKIKDIFKKAHVLNQEFADLTGQYLNEGLRYII